MSTLEGPLRDLESLLGNSFDNAIVWEQRDPDLVGKYVYLKYESSEIGVFMGYLISGRDSIKGCISFFFAHPSSGSEMSEVRRLFHRLLIRLNLKLKSTRYKLVAGKSPALIRTIYFKDNSFSAEKSSNFFQESIQVIRTCEPVYRSTAVDLPTGKMAAKNQKK